MTGRATRLQGAAAMRLVARQVSELMLERGLRWQVAIAPDWFDCLVCGVVMSANLAHLPYRAADGGWYGVLTPAEKRRPVSAMAIARSMNLPYETVRRRVRAMETGGLLSCGTDGLLVRHEVIHAPAAAAAIAEDAAALIRTIEALAASGHAPSQIACAAGPGGVPAEVMARLSIDFAARVLESLTSVYGDVIGGTIVAALVAANVRDLTADPALARRYAGEEEVPPDSLRRPVPVRALARELDLPFETVRRRIAAFQTRDMVEAQADGYIVPARVLMSEEQRDNSRFIATQFERLLQILSRLAQSAAGQGGVDASYKASPATRPLAQAH